MIRVELRDYLDADHPWTRRLLGLEAFRKRRTADEVLREYDGDVYGTLLQRHGDDPQALRERALRGDDSALFVSLGDQIYSGTRRQFDAIKRRTIRQALAEHGGDAPVCELGAGYGNNFFWLPGRPYGGELSANARELARRLGHEVHALDLQHPDTYGFIRPGSTVLTCHAVEQLPAAGVVVDTLKRLGSRIRCVVHFEPLYRAERHDLLGLLRNRYTELNDYNRDLLALLRDDPDVEILQLEADVFGNNPLNPCSLLVWRLRAPRSRSAGPTPAEVKDLDHDHPKVTAGVEDAANVVSGTRRHAGAVVTGAAVACAAEAGPEPPVRFVAEVSSNHHRDLERCLAFVDTAAHIGCDAVKFQLFRLRELFAPEAIAAEPELLEREAWELPVEFLPQLARRARQRGIGFACTPFDLAAVDELRPHVDFLKIASYELTWPALLRACAASGKPVVLSTGMATLEEIRGAVNVLDDAGCADLTLLHCVSGYPTPPEQCNLAALDTLRRRFPGVRVGWSDHSVQPGVIQRAVHAHRAGLVEFHLDLDGAGEEYGTGHCWLPDAIERVIRDVRLGHGAEGTGDVGPVPCEADERDWRADPEDGLRPPRAVRATLPVAAR